MLDGIEALEVDPANLGRPVTFPYVSTGAEAMHHVECVLDEYKHFFTVFFYVAEDEKKIMIQDIGHVKYRL